MALLARNKGLFAAAFVASGQARDVKASDFKDTPIYITVGRNESPRTQQSSSWANELKFSGCDVRFDILQGLEHGDACVKAFTSERLKWVFSHKR